MKFIFTLLVAGFALSASAQSTFVSQVQSADVNNQSQFTKTIQLSDGSFIVVGNAPASSLSGNALLLVKMDEVGRVVSSKRVEAAGQSFYITSLIKTADSGFAISASIGSSSCVFKYKADLTLDWEKQLTEEGNGSLLIYSLYQKKDGSYLLGGSFSNFSQNTLSALVLSLSPSGEIVSSKKLLTRGYGNSGNGFTISGITETGDGNEVLLAGISSNTSTTKDTCLLMKITPEGNVLWSEVVKVAGQGAVGLTMLSTSDNSIVIGGASYVLVNFGGSPVPSYQTMMAKFDENGIQKWITHLESSLLFQSYFQSLTEDKMGNYGFGGIAFGFNSQMTGPEYYNYFASLSADGSLMWTRKVGKHASTPLLQLSSFTATNDGGFVACGKERLSEFDNGAVAALYKYDNTFGGCTGEEADSIGTLIEDGSATSLEVAIDSMTISETDFVTSASDFGTFLYPCNSILPVTLLSFTANLSGSLVNVNWNTANELNADYYIVERSRDGNAFSEVQKVAAKGGSSGNFAYTTADASPLPGTSYYRLKQTDKNGHTTYSSVVMVVRSSNGSATVYPNPVLNTIHLLLQSATSGKMMLQVTDMTGKIVITQSHTVTAGTNTIDIPAAGLSKGVYVVKIIQDSNVQTIRVVKQ